jgi:hypothetical protein
VQGASVSCAGTGTAGMLISPILKRCEKCCKCSAVFTGSSSCRHTTNNQ